jgi:hypothetical protein
MRLAVTIGNTTEVTLIERFYKITIRERSQGRLQSDRCPKPPK